MDREKAWLRENSPYCKHTGKKRWCSGKDCCGQTPVRLPAQVEYPHPQTRQPAWFALYQCPVCKNHRILWQDKGLRLDALCKYRVWEDPDR